MSSPNYDYLDGNAAAGELSKVFAVDITTAAARCAECGTTKCLAEARLYMHGPGLVGAMHCLRARTSSSCECSRADVSRRPWHGLFAPRDIAAPAG